MSMRAALHTLLQVRPRVHEETGEGQGVGRTGTPSNNSGTCSVNLMKLCAMSLHGIQHVAHSLMCSSPEPSAAAPGRSRP